jgi:hypothetical protein
MGEAIGQVLPFAVGVAISPMPIVAVVLMLLSAKARVNGPAFLVGWIVAIAGAGVVLLAIAAPTDPSDGGEPADWINWLKLVLGLLLVLVAVRQWRNRPEPGEEPPPPKWMGALDGFTGVKAFGTAVLLAVVNPKNLILIVGGAAAVAQTEASGGEQAVAWAIFTVIASIGVAVPVAIYFLMGDRAGLILDRVKARMAHGNAAIMAVLCLVIGAKLIGDAITGFSA